MASENGKYFLEFETKAISPNLGGIFLAKLEGSTLGAASAGGALDFALSGADFSSPHFIATTQTTLSLEVPQNLIKTVDRLPEPSQSERRPTLYLDARARLNITGTRLGVSINGAVCETLSGQTSVLIKDLVTDKYLVTDKDPVTDKGMNASPDIVEVKSSTLELVSLRYGALEAQTHVVATQHVRATLCSGENKVQSNLVLVSPLNDTKECERNATQAAIIQQIYDQAWATCERFAFAPSPNLTKSVMSVPCGFGGCGYAPAAAVNDTPASFSDELTEELLKRCLLSELSQTELDAMLKSLEAPKPGAACDHANTFGNALSCLVAFAMVYRVDGLVRVLPAGLSMSQSESWRAEALRSMIQADDCDGSACLSTSIIARAEAIAASDKAFPALRALGNVAAFYVYGTSVLAANAGNADAADDSAKHVAGHAICLQVPKTSFFAALKRGAAIPNNEGKVSIAENHREAAAAAWFEALFPPKLRQKIGHTDFQSREAMEESPFNDTVTGFQVVAIEGTTLASSTLYTHDDKERKERNDVYMRDKKLATRLCPNITRSHKCLDSGGEGETHAFYNAFVELSLSMKHELLTSPALRDIGAATCHFRFIAEDAFAAGATPSHLAMQKFAVVGLWYISNATGERVDEANAEAALNVMPRRKDTFELSDEQSAILEANLETLKRISVDSPPTNKEGIHGTRGVIPFASLVGNRAACAALENVIKQTRCHCNVSGLDVPVPGLCKNKKGHECGLFVIVEFCLEV